MHSGIISFSRSQLIKHKLHLLKSVKIFFGKDTLFIKYCYLLTFFSVSFNIYFSLSIMISKFKIIQVNLKLFEDLSIL